MRLYNSLIINVCKFLKITVCARIIVARPCVRRVLQHPGTLAVGVHRRGAQAHRPAGRHFAVFPKHPGQGLVAAAPGDRGFGRQVLAQHRPVLGPRRQGFGVRCRLLGAQAEPPALGRRVALAQGRGPRRIVLRVVAQELGQEPVGGHGQQL